jgi:hypothetical protein
MIQPPFPSTETKVISHNSHKKSLHGKATQGRPHQASSIEHQGDRLVQQNKLHEVTFQVLSTGAGLCLLQARGTKMTSPRNTELEITESPLSPSRRGESIHGGTVYL